MAADTIAIFDLDGTITRRDTYAAYLLGYLRRHPRAWLRLPLLARCLARQATRVEPGALKAAALGAVFAGADRARIETWNDIFVPWCRARLLRASAVARITAHRQAGHRLLLATASLDLYVRRLARDLGFDETICTRVAWTAEGRIAGTLDGGNLKGEAKLAAVRRVVPAGRAAPFVIAYSDHHADLPLLRWADRAVAVCPTAKLATAAMAEGFAVEEWR
ncbi:MAG TPA: HAD-IB family hydrolase [Stellaceae bacterium]